MPAERIVETGEQAFAILDAYPVSPGHTLVISRRHIPDIFDLKADELADVLRLIWSARDRIDRTLRPTGYNIGVNIGRDAGQTVMHVHVHVIPRYPGDCEDPTGGVRGVIPGKSRYRRGESRSRPDPTGPGPVLAATPTSGPPGRPDGAGQMAARGGLGNRATSPFVVPDP